MSLAVAAGCALSCDQGVSVVPTIQCRPHGMTNSTLFSVRRMIPVLDGDPVARDDQVHALARLDLDLAAAADHALRVVGPDAGRVDDLLGEHVELARRSRGRRRRAPVTRSPSRRSVTTRTRLAHIAPYAAAVRAIIMTWRASSICPS